MRTVDIEGYPDYTISDSGIVLSKARIGRNWHTYEDYQKKPTLNDKGYLCLVLRNESGRKYQKLHRLVALHFVPNPDPSKYNVVNHLDGVKTNCHYTNLEWTDIKGNNKHAIDVLGIPIFGGKRPINKKGKDNPQSKAIVRTYSNGETKEYFGIGQAAREIIENKETISVNHDNVRDNIREALRGKKKHFVGCKWSMKE